MPRRPTYENIVEAADGLFYEQGFEATSFADIAGALGISRGNFYHHFKSKDAILDAVILRRVAATEDMLTAWEADADPKARIRGFIEILIANRAKIMLYGCPVGSLATELAKLDHIAHDRAADIFRLFQRWLTVQFVALGRADAETLAAHLLARTQGVAVLASAFHDEDFLRRETAELIDWLDAIAPARPN